MFRNKNLGEIDYFKRGNEFKSAKNYHAAISNYNLAIKLNPNNTQAYFMRGKSYKKKRLYSLAIADFNKVLRAEPKNCKAYYSRGNAYKAVGQIQLAIADYRRALKINNRYADAYMNRGVANYDLHQYIPALLDFSRSLSLNPVYKPRILDYINEVLRPLNKEFIFSEILKLPNQDAIHLLIRCVRAEHPLGKLFHGEQDKIRAELIKRDSAFAPVCKAPTGHGMFDSPLASAPLPTDKFEDDYNDRIYQYGVNYSKR